MIHPTPPRILAVVGPTASGKTALSVALAKRLGGEIISCDSMQIYRDMTIGTAKPTLAEQDGVAHHLIDFVDPFESYSCAEYVRDARAAILDITSRSRLPVLCGGTGLYLDGVLFGGSFEDTPNDPAVREKWNNIAAAHGSPYVHAALRAVDPESAEAIHPNNLKRVIRALEIYECCGVPKSVLDRRSRERGLCYDTTVIGLRYRSRALLYSRIDHRVDLMLDQGLLHETRMLDEAGVFARNTTAAQAIGYKELLGYLHGHCTLDEAVAQLKTATHHYAKRQMTWFSAKPYVRWLYADTETGHTRPAEDILRETLALCGEVET